jgi:hypothetical protein
MSAVDAQNVVNTKQYQYQIGFPPAPDNPKCDTNVGCRTYPINNTVINDVERVIPVRSDVDTRDRMPSTELFTGPFRARGDGQMNYPDQSNDVRQDVDTRDRMPSTELFAGPFRARGDGQLAYPDQSNDIRYPESGINAQCDRILGEVSYNRFECLDFPLAYEYAGWGGVDSRQGHQVFRCQ